MLNYSQAIRHVIKKGNYNLLFKVIPYAFVALGMVNFFLIFIGHTLGNNRYLIFRILTLLLLIIGFLFFVRTRKASFQNIVFYEIVLAFCFPICQSVALFSDTAIWFLYCAVIIGGLFYGLLAGYFLIPVLASPLLYAASFLFSTLVVPNNLSDSIKNTLGIFIVMWFSAIASSAVRIGFDVFYVLRIALYEQTLQWESAKKLKESTHQKLLLEKQLAQLKSVETLGLYAGGIAHDFNNMLTIIAGQMMSLRRSSTDNLEKESIESIMQAVTKTSGLIKKLLLFTGQYNSHQQVFALNEIVDSVIELLRHGTDHKVEIKSFITPDIAQIHGDPHLFQTSLIGLLFNVISDSKIKSSVHACLSIHDEYEANLKGNYKAETVSIEKTAVLTIAFDLTAQQIWQKNGSFIELLSVVNAMKGKLSVGSLDGLESLEICLPLNKQQPVYADNSFHYATKSKKILVVDDDEMVLKSTEDVLLNAGYTVIACSTAKLAIKTFKRQHKEIDLVLLDMRMPDTSGKDLYYVFKKTNPLVKVIIISGFSSDLDVQEMLNNGVLGYVEKPYSEEVLCAQVASIF